MDGPGVPAARPFGRRHRERPVVGGQARGLRLRRDLRHQQRIRFRLPARQPRGPARGPRAARPAFRDRGRGGLDPDRRGPHAAHHLGPRRGEHRALREDQRARAALQAAGDRGRRGRFLRRREVTPGAPVRIGLREGRRADAGGRAAARRRKPLRPGEHPPDAPPECGAARARPVPEGRRVHRARRGRHHRRRVHRPHHAGTALVGRPAPGGRGQGGRADPRGKPDHRVHHLPELLPPLRQARRHDRHGRHRGVRIPADLRPRGRGRADAPADDPQGHAGPRLPEPGRQVRGDRRGHPRLREARPAGARRHDLDRDVREPLRPPEAVRDCARRAECEAARARGDDHRAGGPAGHRHDRDQHGRPRHGHRARRQRRAPGRSAAQGRRDERGAARRPRARARERVELAARPGDRRRRTAHHRHRAPRVAAHRQPAARPLGPPGRSRLQPFLPFARRQPDAHLRRPRAHQVAAEDGRHEGRRGDRERHADAPDRARAAQGRVAQLRRAQEPAGIRRRRERPAQGDLPPAHRNHVHRRHRGRHQGRAHRGRRQHRRRAHPARQRRGAMGRRRPRGGHGARLRREYGARGLAHGGLEAPRRGRLRALPRRRSRPPTTRSCARSGRR